nr:hypothetical protein [uncultured Sphingomonas sp.]
MAEEKRGAPVESFGWRVERAFRAGLRDAGVRLIDPTLARRLLGAREAAPAQGRNVQKLEVDALGSTSDLIIEVLATPDPTALFGTLYRAEVKRLSDGASLADALSDGQVAPSRRGWVAGPGGFQREAAKPVTPEQVGDLLASQLLASLSARM